MDAAAELDQIVAKDSWSAEDCHRLVSLLPAMRDPAQRFRKLISQLIGAHPDATGAAAIKIGIAKYMLSQPAEALEVLAKGTDNKERRFYQGLCQKHLRRYQSALEDFQRAEEHGWDPRQVTLQMVEVQCLTGSDDAAARSLDRFARSSQEDAEWHCAAGMVAEVQGDYEAAIEHYEKARELQPGHAGATFRLAYHYDLHGEEETAVELYRECIAVVEAPPPGTALEPRPIYANALMNLAVLYEDAGHYDEAACCLQRVLAANPVHARARLFLKDVLSSKTMAFDEDEQKRLARRNDLLAIPITDFELSVRARNCLKKMNIRTLGDLLHVTEQDLLGFKNFGETSLTEIKNVLSGKNLRLGQLREEPAPAQPVQAASGASVENEGVLATPISQIEFSIRARRALQRLNVRTLGELASKTEAELLACRNFGQTSLNEVQQRLAEFGLNLRFSE